MVIMVSRICQWKKQGKKEFVVYSPSYKFGVQQMKAHFCIYFKTKLYTQTFMKYRQELVLGCVVIPFLLNLSVEGTFLCHYKFITLRKKSPEKQYKTHGASD